MEDMERWTSHRAKRIVVPSAYLKHVVERWHVPANKITVIQNAVEPLPTPSLSVDALRAQFSLQQKTILFTIGRAVPWKRWDFLFRVVQSLPESFHLVCAGDGPMLAAWNQKIQELGLTSRITLLGRQSRQDIANWLHASQLFVLPSLYEGFSHVVAEASSIGLPSLVTNTTGNADMPNVFPGLVTSLPPDDLEAWNAAIQSHKLERQPPSTHEFAEMANAYTALFTSSL